jgi:predicted TIM-barrel enzyme
MKLFPNQKNKCAFIGMIHLRALPGTPDNTLKMPEILDAALRDAETLSKGGCDALLVENMADLPYLNGHVGPEIVSAMAIAVDRVVQNFDLPVGVQVQQWAAVAMTRTQITHTKFTAGLRLT